MCSSLRGKSQQSIPGSGDNLSKGWGERAPSRAFKKQSAGMHLASRKGRWARRSILGAHFVPPPLRAESRGVDLSLNVSPRFMS